jgi:hypothetical protein
MWAMMGERLIDVDHHELFGNAWYWNSNSNLYKPIWHKSQCCGLKCARVALRASQNAKEGGLSGQARCAGRLWGCVWSL